MNRLFSPNFWIGVACATGSIGTMVFVIGLVADVPMLCTIGIVLIAPIAIGGVGLVSVVIPILVIANRTHSKKSPGD